MRRTGNRSELPAIASAAWGGWGITYFADIDFPSGMGGWRRIASMPDGSGTAYFHGFCQGARNGYNGAAIRLGVAGDQAGDLHGCTSVRSAIRHSVSVRRVRDLCAFPRQDEAAARPPARRSFDLARALQRADVHVPGGAEQTGTRGEQLPRARAAARQLADDPRRGAEPVRRGSHQ